MADRLTIQRRPIGLLDLFGMKGTGDTPSQVAETLATVLDTTDLYLSDRVDAVTGQFTLNAAGIFSPPGAQFVPPGELWLVYGSHAVGVAAVTAGATVNVTLGAYRSMLSTYQWYDVRGLFSAGEFLVLGKVFARPIILRPGDRAALYATLITGAPNFAVNLTLHCARLLI